MCMTRTWPINGQMVRQLPGSRTLPQGCRLQMYEHLLANWLQLS